MVVILFIFSRPSSINELSSISISDIPLMSNKRLLSIARAIIERVVQCFTFLKVDPENIDRSIMCILEMHVCRNWCFAEAKTLWSDDVGKLFLLSVLQQELLRSISFSNHPFVSCKSFLEVGFTQLDCCVWNFFALLVLPEKIDSKGVFIEQSELKCIRIFSFVAGFVRASFEMLKSLLITINTGDFIATSKWAFDCSFDAHFNMSVDKLTVLHPLLAFWLWTLNLGIIQDGL